MSALKKAKQMIEPLIKRLLPGYVQHDQNRNDRSGALYRSWGMVTTNSLLGAYYEFGVYRGDTFRESYRIYQEYVAWGRSQLQSPEMWRRQIDRNFSHHFYAFDTFCGMPDNEEDNRNFAKGTYWASLEDVKLAGSKVGMVEGERIRYFKGTFADTARIENEQIRQLQPAVLVNIDSDLYASAVDALKIVGSKLQQGTVLLLDDWNCFSASRNHGERRALKEFLEEHPNVQVEDWIQYGHVGQAFIVHLQH